MKRFALIPALVAVSACARAEEKPMATDTAKPAAMAMDSAAMADSAKKADSAKAAAAAPTKAADTKTKSKM